MFLSASGRPANPVSENCSSVVVQAEAEKKILLISVMATCYWKVPTGIIFYNVFSLPLGKYQSVTDWTLTRGLALLCRWLEKCSSNGYEVTVWSSGTRHIVPSRSKSLYHAWADKHTGASQLLSDNSRGHVLARRTVLGDRGWGGS